MDHFSAFKNRIRVNQTPEGSILKESTDNKDVETYLYGKLLECNERYTAYAGSQIQKRYHREVTRNQHSLAT